MTHLLSEGIEVSHSYSGEDRAFGVPEPCFLWGLRDCLWSVSASSTVIWAGAGVLSTGVLEAWSAIILREFN